jgi:aminobenzoyl-glutamate utilization protein B
MNEVIKQWYDEHYSEIYDLAKKIWSRPELAMEEYYACQVVADFMKKYEFDVKTYNCKDSTKPHNTVIATWGTGKPVIGIIGEYDALPGLGQEVAPYKATIEGDGHGCGHCLMSPSGASAAIALKTVMGEEKLSGTVRFIACPAEEFGAGKMYLARDGVFDGLDCCMAWHPEPRNLRIRENVQNSMAHVIVEFFGKAAHAASAPEQGRSALDACELMNVGVNYLREHMDTTSRIHYNYLSAGEKPNVVPAYAAVYYYVRAQSLKSDYELLERVKKCAAGAAMMTETDYKITVEAMASGCIQVSGFNQFFYDSMKKIPPLNYKPEEIEFATELFGNINDRDLKKGEVPVCTGIDAPTHVHTNSPGSTDAGYLTHLVPTSRLQGWGMVCGSPMHSWSVVAAVGHSIGQKAAVFAGMAQAQCGYDILKDPSVINAWWDDLREQIKDDDVKPIFPERVN